MRVYDSLAAIPDGAFGRGTAVVVGKFDGVHRGHQALIDHACRIADARDLEAVVFTFQNNPLSVVNPAACPEPLMSPRQRCDKLAEFDIANCVMIPFDDALAAMPAEQFVREVLVQKLSAKHLTVGSDFRFGHRGAGDTKLLARLAEEHGFQLSVHDDISDQEFGRISSSRVRETLRKGDVAAAARMLGRPVTMRGIVVHGDARGRELGFPTANLGESEGMRPADGVYAGWVVTAGGRYPAAISVGANVTFDPAGDPRVEAHLIDFHEDLYGQEIEVQMFARVRDMVAFDSVEALVEQMREDIREVRRLLS